MCSIDCAHLHRINQGHAQFDGAVEVRYRAIELIAGPRRRGFEGDIYFFLA